MNKKIKIAILVNDIRIPAWAHLMLAKIIETNYCEFVLTIKIGNYNFDQGRVKQSLHTFLFHKIYLPIDRRLFHQDYDAFELKNLETIISTKSITISSKSEGGFSIISNEEISEIQEFQIDIIIDLAYQLMKGKIFEISTYGIWQYYHGDTDIRRGHPTGFWEVFKREGVIGVTLKKLNEDYNIVTIIDKSFYRSDKTSYYRNINATAWKSVPMLSRKIKELYENGSAIFAKSIQERNIHPDFYSGKKSEDHGNFKMITLFFLHFLKNLIKQITSIFYFEQWIILFSINKKNKFTFPLYSYNKILPPKNRFWADPFIVSKEGKYYIFIEELFYKSNRGHISVFEIDGEGNYTMPVEVIKQNYHLSYPFIFEVDDMLFMIPESSENKTIELYKCIKFPYKWELTSCLMENIIAVDSTIHYDGEKYWLFTTIQANEGSNKENELSLFYSDSLFSKDWKPHPKNPLISDVKIARCAGNIFTYNGKLYRPSQNCSFRYGFGLQINEITKLNVEEYEELLVNSVYPNWNKKVLAIHTLNNVENLTVMDCIQKRARF